MKQMTTATPFQNVLAVVLAAISVLALALGTTMAATPAPAAYEMIGANQPVMLSRMTVTATPLPAALPWA